MSEGNFDFSFLPQKLREKLLPFQLKGVQFAIEKHGRCLIGDEMGLGKTLQAISAAYYYCSEWPMLVVLPSSMKYPWIEELEKWLPCLQPNDINLVTSSTDVSNIPTSSVSLVGYGLMQSNFKTLTEALQKQNFKVIIVDESHFLKNPKAARTKTLVPLLLKAKRVLMLSGTPALARPAELFSQVNCLSKGQFGSWSNFAKKYCNAQWKFYGRVRKWDTSGASNLEQLHQKLKATVMIRRQKEEVLTELPPKRRQKVPFELAESKQKKELDTIWEELGLYLKGEVKPKHGGDAGFEIRKLAMNLFVSTGKAKIGAISEYIKMLLDNPEMKFLVFAHHKEVLTAIVQTVQAYAREREPSLKYIRIDGDVPCAERMTDVNWFQQDPNVRVAALSIMAAGTGLTLTAASHVVFAELHWTPGVLEQCEDRAHRIGQVNAIHVHYLIAKGTIDEWMWSALNKKVSVLSSTLNGQLKKMNVEELGGGIGEFLKQAALWLPSSLDCKDDDSFFFSQTTKKPESRDIRSYMQPSQPSPKVSPGVSVNAKASTMQVIECSDEDDIFLYQKDGEEEKHVIDLTEADGEDQRKDQNLESKVKCRSDVWKTSDEIVMLEDEDTTPSNKEEIGNLHQGPKLNTKQSSKVVKTKKGESQESCVGKDKEIPSVASVLDDIIETAQDEALEKVPCSELIGKFSEEQLVHQQMTNPSTSHTSTFSDFTDVLCSKKESGSSDSSDSDCEIIVGCTPWTSSLNQTPRPCHSMNSQVLEDDSKGHISVKRFLPTSNKKIRLSYSDFKSVCGDQKDLEALENQWSCPSCTFLNHESLPLCEICDTPRKQKQTRQVTRRMMLKKKKEKQRISQATVVETLSESDEDFEVLQRVLLESGSKGKWKTKERECVTGVCLNDPKHSLSLCTSCIAKTEEIKHEEERDRNVVPQSSDLSNLETKGVSKQGKEGMITKPKQSFTDVRVCGKQGSKHGIDISESDSDDSLLNMDPFNYSQQGVQNPEYGDSTKFRLGVKDDDSKKSDGKNCLSFSPGNLKHDSNGPSVLANSDSLFSDEENVQEKSMDDVNKVTRLETRKKLVLTEEAIENEVKDVLECLMSSPLTSQTDVEPWTCSEPSCGHVNTTSDVECHNCWAPKPNHSCSSGGKFELVKSSGFMSASEFFTRRGNDKADRSHDSSLMRSSSFKKTGKDAPYQSPTQTISTSSVSEMSHSVFKTNGNKNEAQFKQSSMLLSVEDSKSSAEPKIYGSLLYCASKYTDRIYLYDEDQHPLNSAFIPLDLRICDIESLPAILGVKENMKVARRFLKEWDSLTEMKKRKIKKSGLIFDSPLAAVDALMKKRPFELSTRRFITKDDLANAALQKAEEVGGSIRVIHKTNTKMRLQSLSSSSSSQFLKSPTAGRKRKDAIDEETEDDDNSKKQELGKRMKTKAESSLDQSAKHSFVQALRADGTPLCVFCNGPVQNMDVANSNAAWDTRYCSEQCKHENQVRWKTSKYVREQLLEVESGVCQICGLDAHGIFKTLRDLPKSQRKKYLSETPYATLSVKQLNDMIRNPSEGQFWHADHIIPVYKGGGLCSLENFRTLCVLCHTKVTVEQGQERKKARQEAVNIKEGFQDIRNFLHDTG